MKKNHVPVEYYGIDGSPSLISIGREIMPAFGLPSERLKVMRIEDLSGHADHVICMNVLSNIDNFHRPLERILSVAAKTVILRESISDSSNYKYVRDSYLDEGHRLNVYVNTYEEDEIVSFIRMHGFSVTAVTDRRTNGEPENVIDHPHHWKFIVAKRV